jgi:hypothetical protein
MKTELELERAITECLPLLIERSETLDTILARYPELDQELLRPLEAACWLCERSRLFDPHPGFIRSSRKILVDKIANKKPLAA